MPIRRTDAAILSFKALIILSLVDAAPANRAFCGERVQRGRPQLLAKTARTDNDISALLESLLRKDSTVRWPHLSDHFLPTASLDGVPRSDITWPESQLRKIVSAGYSAIPVLIRSLNDNRRTVFSISGPNLSEIHSIDSNKIDRDSMTLHLPGDFGEALLGRTYDVAIGDLCGYLLGQILNRDYSFFEYRPTMNVAILRIHKAPTVKKALEKTWGNISEASHKQSLIRDIEVDFAAPSNKKIAFLRPTVGAIMRLAFYYPDDAERLSIRLLRRPLFDRDIVRQFVKGRLLVLDDASAAADELSAFHAAFGAVESAGVFRILRSQDYENPSNEKRLESLFAARADRALIALPGLTKSDVVFDCASVDEQVELIGAMSALKTKRLDDQIVATFRVLERQYSSYCTEKTLVDDYVAEMVKRDPNNIQACMGYIKKRIAELENRKLSFPESRRLVRLSELISDRR